MDHYGYHRIGKQTWGALALAMLLPVVFVSVAGAYDPQQRTLMATQKPVELQDVGITEKLGDSVDLTLPFKDETGQAVRLGDYYHKGKPVILSLVYYTCPHLCNFHLNGLTDGMKQLSWDVGNQFEVVAITIDPKETPDLAQAKKNSYLKSYGRLHSASGWHFLTGTDADIKKIAAQVGYKYHWDEAGQQWAHASAAVITTPSGKISRYLHGISFEPQSLRMALVEASEGKVGNVLDSLIMFCFQFDPAQRKYVFYAWNIMRAMAGGTVLIIGTWLGVFWFRQRKQLHQNVHVKGVPS